MTEARLQSLDHKPRHPELVSGSISRSSQAMIGARWMLKWVQHDGCLGRSVAYWRQTQIYREIKPLRVFRFNQIDLPRAVPVFQLFLSRYRAGHVVEYFKSNQAVDRIFRSVAGHQIVPVLVQALDQVRGYTDVKGAVSLAREYINAWLFRLSHGRYMDEGWTLKQVQGDGFGVIGRE